MAKKPKLNQVIAVVAGQKSAAQKLLTEAHNHKLKPALLTGLYRNYRPTKEDGEHTRPSEDRGSDLRWAYLHAATLHHAYDGTVDRLSLTTRRRTARRPRGSKRISVRRYAQGSLAGS